MGSWKLSRKIWKRKDDIPQGALKKTQREPGVAICLERAYALKKRPRSATFCEGGPHETEGDRFDAGPISSLYLKPRGRSSPDTTRRSTRRDLIWDTPSKRRYEPPRLLQKRHCSESSG